MNIGEDNVATQPVARIGINTLFALFGTRVGRYLAPHARLGTPKKKHYPRKHWANNPNRKFGIHVRP